MLWGFQNLAFSIENRVSAFMCLPLAWTVLYEARFSQVCSVLLTICHSNDLVPNSMGVEGVEGTFNASTFTSSPYKTRRQWLIMAPQGTCVELTIMSLDAERWSCLNDTFAQATSIFFALLPW